MSAETRAGGFPVVWIVVFAVVTVALVASTVRFLSGPYRPARHIDLEASRLVREADGSTTLHLAVRDVPEDGRLDWRVLRHESGAHEVEIDYSAETGSGDGTPGDTMLRIPLPPLDRVQVIDRRWGDPEGLEIALERP